MLLHAANNLGLRFSENNLLKEDVKRLLVIGAKMDAYPVSSHVPSLQTLAPGK